MPKDVKAGRRINLGATASLAKRTMLMRSSPWASVPSGEHQRGANLADNVSLEECHTILCQHDMTGSPRLADTHTDGAGIAIEVRCLEIDDFAIPAAGQKRALHQRTETRIRGIDEPPRLGMGEIADLRGARFAERFDPPPHVLHGRQG